MKATERFFSRRTVNDKNFLTFCVCRFSSVSKGTTWSVVLYSITAAAACREQHWREASQAFYRVSMVYSNMQSTACAGTLYQLTTFPDLSLHFPRASPPFLTLSRSFITLFPQFHHTSPQFTAILPQFYRTFIAFSSHFIALLHHFQRTFLVHPSHFLLFPYFFPSPRSSTVSSYSIFGYKFLKQFLSQSKQKLSRKIRTNSTITDIVRNNFRNSIENRSKFDARTHLSRKNLFQY